jgi:galactokinase
VDTLAEWRAAVAGPGRERIAAEVRKLVPPSRVERDVAAIESLVGAACRDGNFEPSAPVAIVRSPGRARIFMGHADLTSIGGSSIDVGLAQSLWMVVQLSADGRVDARSVDPGFPPVSFPLSGPGGLVAIVRDIRDRARWSGWCRTQHPTNRWEGLVTGTFAVLATPFFDARRSFETAVGDRGLRILVGESDLPSGRGLSASSAVPAGIGTALRHLLPGAVPDAALLPRLDYAAFIVEDWGGLADITAILRARPGEALVQWYDSDRAPESLVLPDGVKTFAVDSKVSRDRFPDFAKHTKSLTSIGPSLAVLWLRASARRGRAPAWLEDVLTAHTNADAPFGLLRELTAAGALASNGAARAALGAAGSVRGLARRLITILPYEERLDAILGEITDVLPEFATQVGDLERDLVPLAAAKDSGADAKALLALRRSTMISLRQLAAYAVEEIERGLEYSAAARAGAVARLCELANAAHDGDRAIFDPGTEPIERTEWGRLPRYEAFQRSLPEIDRGIDAFLAHFRALPNASPVGARISGAGLGGLILIHASTPAADAAVAWWRDRGHGILDIEPSAGVRALFDREKDRGVSG